MNKLILSILTLILFVTVTSCSDSEKEPAEEILYHANLTEIQGIWRNEKNAQYHDFYFDGNTYHIEVNNAINIGYEGGPVRTEDGEFILIDDTVTFYPYEGESYFSNSQATVYWADASHSALMIMPIGKFKRYTPPVTNPDIEE